MKCPSFAGCALGYRMISTKRYILVRVAALDLLAIQLFTNVMMYHILLFCAITIIYYTNVLTTCWSDLDVPHNVFTCIHSYVACIAVMRLMF